ncbi:MAG TPA: FtsX-like permease family protein, partial [Bryobacteraceae bacterium]|nr:FtsX-like permease family protein [Bryobacteraceae bacterium]
PVTFSHWLNLTLLVERLVAGIVGALSALGLLLATIGLAGAVSSSVSQRTRELGLRVALGAGSAQLLNMILGQVLAVAGTGVALGLALGIGGTILLQSKFYQIGPVEWTVLLPVAAMMLTVSLLVAWLAARPWLNADPMIAVRHN